MQLEEFAEAKRAPRSKHITEKLKHETSLIKENARLIAIAASEAAC